MSKRKKKLVSNSVGKVLSHGINSDEDKERHKRMQIHVVSVCRFTDTPNIEVTLKVWNFLIGDYVEETILRTDITRQALEKMVNRNGGVCYEIRHCYDAVIRRVNVILQRATKDEKSKVALKHRTLGWSQFDGQEVFNCSRIITKDGDLKSTYIGGYNVKGTGSLAAIQNLYNRCFVDHIPMQAVMSMAAAATVLPQANRRWGLSLDNPINHLAGDTSEGKSSAAYLFMSFGMFPQKNSGLFLSFTSTANALIKSVEGNEGYPVVIDEFSTAKKSGWDSFVYTLANGQGRDRCSAGGRGLYSAGVFETVFMTTGEAGILQKCDTSNGGLRARLFEFQEVEWTRSAEEAKLIKDVAKKNYGILTPRVAQELVTDCDNHWKCRFEYWYRLTQMKIKKDKVISQTADRTADFVALYMVSSEILCKILKVKMATAEVFRFFFQHLICSNADEGNLGERAYDALLEYYSRHRSSFPDADGRLNSIDGYNMAKDEEGFLVDLHDGHIVDGKKYKKFILFTEDAVDKAFAMKKINDRKIALKRIQKMGLLRAKDKNRVYKEEIINGITQKVYCIWADILF